MKLFSLVPFFTLILLGITVTAFAQTLNEKTNYSMSIFLGSKASEANTATITQSVKIDTGHNKVAIYITGIAPSTKSKLSTDTSIVDAVTLTPIYHSSFSSEHECVLHYGKHEVSGYYIDKQTGKKTTIKDPVNESIIDGSSLDYMFTKFLLSQGLKKNLSVYNYNPGSKSNISKVSIDDVENAVYASTHFGSRNVWKITLTVVTPSGEQRKYIYHVDKDTRRIWQCTVEMGGVILFYSKNDEDDYNPYHSNFDKQATLKLITDGKSVIAGQAFAREGNGSKIQIVNFNKKQIAPMGTAVVLIPYTSFFKEWFQQNKKASKSGRSAPLPKSAAECVKTTKVSDKEGSFEFTNLMPGDYLLLTQFTEIHGASQTDVTGYTDTYIDGAYQGTNTNTVTHYFSVLLQATAQKVVTIKQDGEKVTIKLKQIQQ